MRAAAVVDLDKSHKQGLISSQSVSDASAQYRLECTRMPCARAVLLRVSLRPLLDTLAALHPPDIRLQVVAGQFECQLAAARPPVCRGTEPSLA